MDLTLILGKYKWIIDIVAYLIAVGSVIIKITPTVKDDNILLPIIKFIGKFIALDKYTPPERPK